MYVKKKKGKYSSNFPLFFTRLSIFIGKVSSSCHCSQLDFQFSTSSTRGKKRAGKYIYTRIFPFLPIHDKAASAVYCTLSFRVRRRNRPDRYACPNNTNTKKKCKSNINVCCRSGTRVSDPTRPDRYLMSTPLLIQETS